jgi:hypothetical protein
MVLNCPATLNVLFQLLFLLSIVRIKYDWTQSISGLAGPGKMVELHLLFREVFAILSKYESYTQCKVCNN